jgi:hypothetical protein
MRLYTLEEASALLPQVIPVLESLRAAFRELRAMQAAVATQARGASGDGHLLADPWTDVGEDRAGAASDALQAATSRLDAWEIEVKDPDRGLIDFYHERGGRTVYLCFHLGETSIGYWHELGAGFAGRQPI